VSPEQKVELVGASQASVAVTGMGARTIVRLDPAVRRKVAASLAAASETSVPDRTYLQLENVRGTYDATVLSVYINLPERARPSEHPELLAGSVGLFGLRRASETDGEHAGAGLDFIFDITKITDALHMERALDVDSLPVSVIPHRPIPPESPITIGRVSIYREGR
jgi:tyrosinase